MGSNPCNQPNVPALRVGELWCPLYRIQELVTNPYDLEPRTLSVALGTRCLIFRGLAAR